MRVMLVTGEYPPDEGGVADYTRCLAEALVTEGVEVVVATSERVEASAGPRKHGADALAASEGESGVSVLRDAPAWGWGALRWLRSQARSTSADWVHIQYQAAAFGMRPAIHLAPWVLASSVVARTAVTYHDLKVPYLFPKAGPVRRWAVRSMARFSDLTFATNSEDFGSLDAWGGSNRLTLVPIGSNIPDELPDGYDRNEWRRTAGVADAEDLVCYFGFLNTSKGARDLAAALSQLVESGHEARLVMIGGQVGASDSTNADYLESFRDDLGSRGLVDRVILTGHVPATEVSAWLHAADVAALPYVDGASYRRGSLLAALTHGVPIVTTDPGAAHHAPGSPPPLTDGKSVRLVPAGDAIALASALSEVLRDADGRSRLSTGARELSQSFTWSAIAKRHVAEYGRA